MIFAENRTFVLEDAAFAYIAALRAIQGLTPEPMAGEVAA